MAKSGTKRVAVKDSGGNPLWPKTNPFPKNHPLNDAANHEKLLQWIKDRLTFSNVDRENMIGRFASIDRQLSGYVKLNEADKKRQRDNVRGFGPKPTEMNLTLTKSQLDERLTYLMSVFWPEGSGMFEALAKKAEQWLALAFTKKLNDDAIEANYYFNMAKGLWDMLKYQIGGWETYWEAREGNKLGNTNDGKLKLEKGIVWAGSCMQAIDPYNFLWDKSVTPWELADKGEFYATVRVWRQFSIEKMATAGYLFGVDRFLMDMNGSQGGVPSYANTWYRAKPAIRLEINDVANNTDGARHTDWISILTLGNQSEATTGVELVNYVGWIVPERFGLSDSKELEVWRIVMANGAFICNSIPLKNAHGKLPISLASPNDEGLEMQEKSDAELLQPLNTFASFLLNVHQQASRKALYGVTLYDPQVVPIREIPDGEVAGFIPIKPTGTTKDIRAHFQQFYDSPGTDKTMEHMKSVIDLMQHLLPTNIQQQVASLERATMYQAAATVQGTNRRSLKLANVINAQAVQGLKMQIMYNLLEKGDTIKMTDPNGQEKEVGIDKLRDANLEFTMSEGLKGIDRLLIVEAMKEILMAIIQNPDAMQEIDVVDMLNYWSTLLGEKADLTQFRKRTFWQTLPPQVQQMVEQLIQSGQLNPMLQKMMQAQAQAQIGANDGQPQQGLLPDAEAIKKQEGMKHRADVLQQNSSKGGSQ